MSLRVTDGGASAVDPDADVPHLIAPTVDARGNTIRPKLRPAVCWRLDDLRFHFDSSFVLASGSGEFSELAARRPPTPAGTDPELLMSVFGHADPTGDDDYNAVLSGRRAQAVFGVLTRRVDLWEALFTTPHGGDVWGTVHVQLMLQAVGHPEVAPTGFVDPATDAAVRSFQEAHGLTVDGVAGPDTRAVLFEVYMDAICVDPAGEPFRYEAGDFVSRGESQDGKGDVQGCSEFNPIRVFSQEQEATFQNPAHKAERDELNRTNRRVLVYMFRRDLGLDPNAWPCPTVKEGTAACRARFWADGDARRSPGALPREHLLGGRTFACAFYDRLARGAPCEGVRGALSLFLIDQHGRRMGARPTSDFPQERDQGAPYRLRVGSQVREGRADAQGRLLETNLYLGGACELQWGRFPSLTEQDEHPVPDDLADDPPFLYQRTIFVGDEASLSVEKLLHNLGYVDADVDENKGRFRGEHDVAPGETLDDAIRRVHREGREGGAAAP